MNNNNNQNETKTVVNGKVVSVKQAHQMEQLKAQQAKQTGIQAHHNNNTEAVEAGQTASNPVAQQAAELNIKQGNIQSGQSHLQQAQAQSQNANNQENAQSEQQAQQAAKAKTKKAD